MQNHSPPPLFFSLLSIMWGSLISSTDPFAIMAVMENFGMSAQLITYMTGESTLSMGVSVMAFSAAKSYIDVPDVNWFVSCTPPPSSPTPAIAPPSSSFCCLVCSVGASLTRQLVTHMTEESILLIMGVSDFCFPGRK